MRTTTDEKEHSLNDFKDEKISEALGLISIIKELGPNIEISQFIIKIKQLCRKSLSILYDEVEQIDSRIKELNNILVNRQPEHDWLTEKDNDYRVDICAIYDLQEKDLINYEDYGPINGIQFNNFYPGFKNFRNQYNAFFSEYRKIECELRLKNRLKATILIYI